MPILRPLRNRTLNPHPKPPTPQKKPDPASRHPTHGAQPLNQPKGERGKPAQKPRPHSPLTRRPPRRNPHTTHTPTPTQPHQPHPDTPPTRPSPETQTSTPPRKCANTHSNNPHTRQGGRQSDHTHTPNSSPTSPRQEPFPATKPKAPKGRSPESAKSADRVVLFKGFKVLNFLNRTVQTSLPGTLLRTVRGTVPEQFRELFEPFPHSENAYISSPTSNAEKETKLTPKNGVNTARQKGAATVATPTPQAQKETNTTKVDCGEKYIFINLPHRSVCDISLGYFSYLYTFFNPKRGAVFAVPYGVPPPLRLLPGFRFSARLSRFGVESCRLVVFRYASRSFLFFVTRGCRFVAVGSVGPAPSAGPGRGGLRRRRWRLGGAATRRDTPCCEIRLFVGISGKGPGFGQPRVDTGSTARLGWGHRRKAGPKSRRGHRPPQDMARRRRR